MFEKAMLGLALAGSPDAPLVLHDPIALQKHPDSEETVDILHQYMSGVADSLPCLDDESQAAVSTAFNAERESTQSWHATSGPLEAEYFHVAMPSLDPSEKRCVADMLELDLIVELNSVCRVWFDDNYHSPSVEGYCAAVPGFSAQSPTLALDKTVVSVEALSTEDCELREVAVGGPTLTVEGHNLPSGNGHYTGLVARRSYALAGECDATALQESLAAEVEVQPGCTVTYQEQPERVLTECATPTPDEMAGAAPKTKN